ncbi:MAG: TldD/PmbA family protein [Bacteroidales bacterium]|nr:TldD/PmbA family protein [Bacteroidales bacterium]
MMHLDIARNALEFALKQGCEAARVELGRGVQSAFSARNRLLEKVHQAAGSSLGLQLFVEGRYGSYSTNRLESTELHKFIKEIAAKTRLLTPDPARSLPHPERYYKGAGDMQQYDSQQALIGSEEKRAIALESALEVWGSDARMVSVETEFSDGYVESYLIDSSGFEGYNRQTFYNLSAEVVLRDLGDARPAGWWYEAALFKKELPAAGCAQKALDRALAKLNPGKLLSGHYHMVVDTMVAAQLLAPLLSALSGPAIQQNNSFLMNKSGTQVGSALLCLHDRPLLVGQSGARFFDAEGVATQSRTIFEQGTLHHYFIDTYHANKLQMSPTIGSPSLLEWGGGKGKLSDLLSQVDRGVLVTGFNGGNCNSSTGDFSYGIEGFMIERGKQGAPISEMLISGNMLDLWMQLVGVAQDARLCSSQRIPSLAFENISFSGI